MYSRNVGTPAPRVTAPRYGFQTDKKPVGVSFSVEASLTESSALLAHNKDIIADMNNKARDGIG